MRCYEDRDIILIELGFKDYDQYLKSPLWKKQIRPRIIKLFNSECVKCNTHMDKYQTVHHMIYTKENLSGESDAGLILICRKCHETAEFKLVKRKGKQPQKVKQSLQKANAHILGDPIKTKKCRNSHPHSKNKRKRCTMDTCNNLTSRNNRLCKRCKREQKKVNATNIKRKICDMDACINVVNMRRTICRRCQREGELKQRDDHLPYKWNPRDGWE